MNPWSNTLQGFILLNFLFLGLLDNLIRTGSRKAGNNAHGKRGQLMEQNPMLCRPSSSARSRQLR